MQFSIHNSSSSISSSMGGQRIGSKLLRGLLERSLRSTKRYQSLFRHWYVHVTFYSFMKLTCLTSPRQIPSLKTLETSQWMALRRLTNWMNISRCPLREFMTPLHGGGSIVTLILSCLLWPLTFLVPQVCIVYSLFYHWCSYLNPQAPWQLQNASFLKAVSFFHIPETASLPLPSALCCASEIGVVRT